jgi:hypothetical protein
MEAKNLKIHVHVARCVTDEACMRAFDIAPLRERRAFRAVCIFFVIGLVFLCALLLVCGWRQQRFCIRFRRLSRLPHAIRQWREQQLCAQRMGSRHVHTGCVLWLYAEMRL